MPKAHHVVDAHLGKRLLEARRKCGLTEEQAAERLEISLTQLRLYENGVKRVQPQHLIRAAQVMQVSLSWFFEDAPATPTIPGHGAISQEVARFLALPDAYELMRHFINIADRQQRQTLVNFAQTLADLTPTRTGRRHTAADGPTHRPPNAVDRA